MLYLIRVFPAVVSEPRPSNPGKTKIDRSSPTARDLNGRLLASYGYRNAVSIIRSCRDLSPRGRRHSEIGKYIFMAKRLTRYSRVQASAARFFQETAYDRYI